MEILTAPVAVAAVLRIVALGRHRRRHVVWMFLSFLGRQIGIALLVALPIPRRWGLRIGGLFAIGSSLLTLSTALLVAGLAQLPRMVGVGARKGDLVNDKIGHVLIASVLTLNLSGLHMGDHENLLPQADEIADKLSRFAKSLEIDPMGSA